MTTQSADGLQRIMTSMVVPLHQVDLPDGWELGPLPGAWRAGTGKAVSGDIGGRLPYIDDGLEDLLYRRGGTSLIRRHHIYDPPLSGPRPGAVAEALEILQLPTAAPIANALLVVHVRIDPAQSVKDIKHSLNYITNHNPRHADGARSWIREIVEPWATVSRSHRRAQHVTLVTGKSPTLPNMDEPPTGDPVDTTTLWLAALASSGRYRPDPASLKGPQLESSEAHLVWMSDNLRGVVSRDGFMMVGLKADTPGTGGRHGFDYDGAQFFAQGLYTDVLLLATAQRLGLDALSMDVESLHADRSALRALDMFEKSFSDFRSYVWRQTFAPQGSQDEVLVALQAMQHLPEQESRVARSLTEVSAQSSRVEQMEVGNLLRTLTILGVAWGFVWTWLDGNKIKWRFNAIWVVAVLVLCLLIVRPGFAAAVGLKWRPRKGIPKPHFDWKLTE